MDNVKISVHIIAKEVSFYGYLLLKASLKSVFRDNEGYCDEVIVFDDGCDDRSAALLKECVKNCVNSVYIATEGDLTFAQKRNVCLDNTGDVTHIHWIDTDDIYYPNTLMQVKSVLANTGFGRYLSEFHHAMGYPWRLEDTYPKDNIFRYNKDLKWGKGVHECLENVAPNEFRLGLKYYHSGYTRSVISTAIKWIYYSVLEHGEDNCCYLRDNEVMYTDGPHKIISDRIPKTSKLTFEDLPDAFVEEVMGQYSGLLETEHWDKWVNNIDSKYAVLFEKFKKIASDDGHWGTFVSHVIEHKLWKEM